MTAETMTDAELDALEARYTADAATEYTAPELDLIMLGGHGGFADCEVLAGAMRAMPRLLAEVRRLRGIESAARTYLRAEELWASHGSDEECALALRALWTAAGASLPATSPAGDLLSAVRVLLSGPDSMAASGPDSPGPSVFSAWVVRRQQAYKQLEAAWKAMGGGR